VEDGQDRGPLQLRGDAYGDVRCGLELDCAVTEQWPPSYWTEPAWGVSFLGLSQAAAEEIAKRETAAGYLSEAVDPTHFYFAFFDRTTAASLLAVVSDNQYEYEIYKDDGEVLGGDFSHLQYEFREFLGDHPPEIHRVGREGGAGDSSRGESAGRMILAVNERTEWTVVLKSGESVIVHADSVSDEEGSGELVFDLLIEGATEQSLSVARFNLSSVKSWTATTSGRN